MAADCMPWEGPLSGGYGQLRLDGRKQWAHRAVYEHQYGPIPPDKVVHHDCGNKACVNPHHLSLMGRREHNLHHLTKTHCPHGHELVGSNLYLHPNGSRKCRRCSREQMRKRRERGV